MSDNIKVVVKVRPLISREIEDKLSYQWRVRDNTLHQIDQNGKEFGSSFTFDKVYDKDTRTREVYNDVAKPIVEAAIAGFNGTIFAYGQTSSGKTYTMTGTESSPGIIPMAVLNLFEIIKTAPDRDFLVRVSYIEIYNETLKDLLDVNKKNIKIHDSVQGVKVDATERVTSSPEEVLDAMKEGEANRQTGATNMNEESSRSHSIFQITIESREHIEGEEEVGCVNVSQLNLVDLAGSERAGQTGATGLRFKEGTHINKSLSVLALVIKQLSEDPNKYANYRDSKLTRILQNSLGGNAKTSIICAITPASVEETISTLQFANRATAIKNKPEVNAVATNATMIQSLTKQLSKLQSQLESKKNVEQNNAHLQKQIANLRKLILNGFGQKSSIDMMGTSRRKQQPPRRITISTLHPIEEDPVPTVPRFCTPSLKYNPMTLPMEFLPIQNASKPSLTSLPEEARIITPPPPDKKVNFDDEIIELDSDDDSSEVKTCSPYHKCYGSSKTPPCILRKNAKQAEKSLKDIVELTEREKMYSPNVVELMEKLDQNTNVIAKLEEEIRTLNDKGKEKDLELELLRNKISKTEEQVTALTNTKTDLEILCNNYNTKVTDWEVSYETLKKIAKSREQDLLSLLEEQKVKKVEDIGKLSRTLDKEQVNFMDMSKDISLVNSENSIANSNDDDSSTQLQELVTDLQSQLSSKSEAILELESNIIAQKQKIESLENTSLELQAKVGSFKDKISEMEIENSYLKSMVKTLNSTINNQKECLETANKDIKSFNSMIEDLQIKLNNKDNLLNIKITDSALETMIANEERFIANNDNMKNIIHSFKITLDSRNKEIESLKSTIQTSTELSIDNVTLKEQVESKEKHIKTLIEEVETLKGQLNENIEMINKLMSLEKQLCNKVCVVEEQNALLQKNVAEKSTEIDRLKEQNEQLSNTVSEKDVKEQEITSTNNYLTKQIEDMSHKIVDLERDITLKDNLIFALNNINDDVQKHFNKANSTLIKVHNILTILECNTQDIPEAVDSFELFLTKLENNLNILESKATQISEDNKENIEKTLGLKEQITTLLEKYQSETEGFQIKIENLSKERNEILQQYEDLSNQMIELTQEIDNVRQQQDEKHLTNINLETKLNEARESNENLRNDLLSKDDLLLSLQEKISALNKEIELISQNNEQNHSDLKQKIDNLNTNQESLEQILKDRDSEISHLQNLLEEHRVQVSTLTRELTESRDSRDHLLNNILDKISKLTHDFSIENNISCDHDNDHDVYEKILLIVDKISNHIVITKKQNICNQTAMKDVLSEDKDKITNLTQQNLKLMEAYAEIDFKNQELFAEIEKIMKINAELSGTSELLEQLRSELKQKATELENMTANKKSLEQMLMNNNVEISQLQNTLEEQRIKNLTITQELNEYHDSKNHLLNNILDKVLKVTHDFSIEKTISCDLDSNHDIYEKILLIVDKISNHIVITKKQNICNQTAMKDVLSEDKDKITNLTQQNLKLMEAYAEIDFKNQELFAEIEKIMKINAELSGTSELLEQLRSELKQKATELENMTANKKSLEQMLMNNNVEISQLQNTLEEQRIKNLTITQELNEYHDSKNHLLNNILDKVLKVTHDFSIEKTISCDLDSNHDIYEKILLIVDKISNHIVITKKQNICNQTAMKDVLSEDKEKITDLTQQNLELMEAYTEIDFKNQELFAEIEKIMKINAELSGTSELLEKLRSELKQKATEQENMTTNQKSLEQMLMNNDVEISKLQNTLEEQRIKILTITQELNDCRDSKNHLLNNILDKVLKVTHDFSIENSNSCDLENIYEKILLTVDEIANHMVNTKTENNCNQAYLKDVISEAKKQIADLTQQHHELMEAYAEIDFKNQELFAEMEEIKIINDELSGSSEILEQLKAELKVKATELDGMQGKAYELKEKFTKFESVIKEQMNELQAENELLKERVTESDIKAIKQANVDNSIDKPTPGFVENTETKSPQSLLTICCNRIIEAMEPDKNDFNSISTSSSKENIKNQNTDKETICECAILISKLQTAHEENSKLKDELQHLEFMNQILIKEQEEVRKEIQLLMEPANELQKKIINHRTNMSTLTATTYAENKLLNSQLKVLKHHHTRCIHVCQRDIPAFKTQLHELMAILKGTPFSVDKQNVSFKRYSLPDVLDSNATVSNFKNESTLDGDLLMLDTNVTLATSADNTLLGNDQTCLDITQINFDSEVACQTNDLSTVLDPCLVYSQVEILTNNNQKLCEKLQALQEENFMLKEQIDKYSVLDSHAQKVDAHSSPIKINGSFNNSLSNTLTEDLSICKDSKHEDEFTKDKLIEEIRQLSQELIDVRVQKEDIEKKYANLTLEMPSTDALVKKLCILEKEYNKLTNDLTKKNKMVKDLQEENDSLSNQVMDNISEADDLRKELDMLKEVTNELKQLDHLEKLSEGTNWSKCPQCKVKDELINTLQNKQTSEAHKLNRSLSDIDSSSRFNKIYTLQNELHASKEDCKKITEEVATIKNHLDRNNLSMSESMDLDGSIGDSNIFTFTKNYEGAEPNLNKFNMPNIPEERPSDMYTIDKIDCFNYFVEKTGANKDNLNCDVKIIDVMKMLYDTLVTKHGNEVENLVNKLKDFDESKNQLQTQIENLTEAYSKTTQDLKLKDDNIKAVMDVLSQIRSNIQIITKEIPNILDSEKNTKFVTMFKENLLKVLDTEFDLSSVNMFESLIDSIVSKHQKDLNGIMKQYAEMQQHMETVVSEFKIVNDNLTRMKSQLSDKENEYSLLKAQKERVHEISNAVTKDIVELNETVAKGCKRLVELNIVSSDEVDLTQSLSKNLNIIFERLISLSNDQNKSDLEKEKECLMCEVTNLKKILEEKEQQLETLKANLLDAESKFQAQLSLQNDINKLYENKIEENKSNVVIIENLTLEIQVMQKTILEKDATIQTLEAEINSQKDDIVSAKQTIVTEGTKRIQDLVLENEQLKYINDVITKEKEAYSIELENLGETIKKNKIDLDRMTADVLVLRETVKDNVSVIESLTLEAKSLLQQNEQMKKQWADKCQNCTRLESNIKTHEKTAEIQIKIIIRLQKQKEQDEQAIADKNKQLEELIQNCAALQKETDDMKLNIKASREEIDSLKSMKLSLEARVSDLEMEVEHVNKNRLSIEGIVDNARRRRQSLHDSQRIFTQDFEDNNKIEALFGSRGKPDDLFMDVDDDSSNRSTPNRLSKGRDSFQSRPDQSDKDEETRPSSVLATRRRRQSSHDLHRSVVRHTPSPRESMRLKNELKDIKSDASGGISTESEVSQLRQCLTSCQQELEELRQQYKELDEECETCAEYLRERDEQCGRLKKEKIALEKQVEELNDKWNANLNRSEAVPKLSSRDASVNTDEDWANLHSVVVDRMSFDAEVEKNKKLTKTIEELRYNKQELKTTLAKMQRAMEKHSGYKDSRELEITKSKLKACQQELEELRQQYKELDEECETCAQYLRERDEQCLKLKQAKVALEAKLQELQDDSGNILQSVRKKRQSQHDQNRAPTPDLQDAATETSDDLLSYQVERDESFRGDNALARELKQVRAALDKVSREKTGLEQMLASVPPTMFVATGSAIVQNQQLTDVMKENHKLKKINAKLINICKKRGKSHESNRENEEPNEMG